MAWAFVANRGISTNKAAIDPLVITPLATISAGSILVVFAAFDSSLNGASDIGPVTDSKGNTYSLVLEAFPQGSETLAQIAIYASKLTAELTTADTVSIQNNSLRSALCGGLSQFSVAAGKTFSVAGTNTADGNGTTPSATISGLSSIERLWFGLVGVEGPNTDSFTQDADYANATVTGTSGAGAASNMSLRTGTRIATLTGDTYNPTITGRDWTCGLAALDEVDDVVTERHQTRRMRSAFGYR